MKTIFFFLLELFYHFFVFYPLCAGHRIFWTLIVNSMSVDTIAPCVTRSSRDSINSQVTPVAPFTNMV